MKKTKRIITVILGIISIFSFAFSVGCREVDPLTVDRTPSGSSGLVFEYMTDREIPVDIFTGITEKDVNSGKVSFVFTSPEYLNKGETTQDVYSSKFPAIYCNVVGEWTVTFVKGNKHDTKTFEVKDTVKPEFEVASRAYDVWFDAIVDENGTITDKGTRYTLPMIFPEDLSEFDYDTMVQTLTIDTDLESEDNQLTKVTILPGDRYYAPAIGKMTYTISISDIHGNNNSYTTSWNVKDPNWRDAELEEGYLADYDDVAYINSVYSGNMSSYWLGSEITESYLDKDQFEEETGVKATSGVVKVTAKPTDGYAVGAFGFKLSKDLTKEDVVGKYLVVKFYTPNNVETVRYGCKTWQTKGNPPRNVEAVHSIAVNVVPNNWSYAVISTAMLNEGYFSLGDTVINEYQIAFGERTKSVQDDEIILYVDEVALAEKLDGITGLEISGNTISWNAVDGADGYEVSEDGKVTVVNTNSYTATNPDGVITVRAISYSARYLSNEYPTTFINTTNFGEHDLALFDSKSYESIVTKSTRAHRIAKSVEAEVLSSYAGATNVLKVVSTAKDGGIADFRIKLPKECSDGITVRFMIKSTPANFFYWMNPSVSEDKSISDSANVLANQALGSLAEKWQIVYIPYASSDVKDVIEVLVLDNANKAEGGVTEVYFDEILSGDRRCDFKMADLSSTLSSLEDKLPEGYLADFSSKDYEQLVVTDTWYNHHVAESVTAEYVENFRGYANLMKVTTLNNENAGGFGNFTIYLPKAMTEGGYTVRFMLAETTSTGALRIGKPHTEIAPGTGDIIKEYHPLEKVIGVWTEVYIPYDGEHNQEITFQIFGNVDGRNVFYFDYIADGDVVEEMAAQRNQKLADKLPESYLADFNDDIYINYVMPDPWGGAHVAESITAEVVDEYDGKTNLLKVTTLNNENTFGNFTLNLPKTMGEEGFTIRFKLASTTSNAALRIIKPYTEGANQNGEICVLKEWHPLDNVIGEWVEVFVPYTGEYKQLVSFQIWGNAEGENVFYIDYVADGDKVCDFQMERLEGTLNDLASKLPEGYLADFSSKDYEKLVVTDTWVGHHVADSVTAEVVGNFKGYTNLLKVTTENNASGFGNFTIYLPKAMNEGGYTVRFYLETTSNAALRIIKPHTEGAPGTGEIIKEYHPLSLVNGLWTEVFIPYDGEHMQEITFLIFGGADGVNTFYFDYIANGDVVEKMAAERAQAIVDALPEGYLADFSSELYEGMIGNPKHSVSLAATSLVAEHVEEFDGCTDLMKITTVNNGNGSKFGGFSIDLPKAMPTTSGFTVSFYIESTGSRALRIINPASNSVAVSNKHEWVDATLDAIVGKWTTIYVPYSETYADASTVEFMFFMNKVSGTSGTNVIYIDGIYEGNVVDKIAEEKLQETLKVLADKLPEGYLADFSSKDYEAIAVKDTWGGHHVAKSITAEQLATYKGYTNLLKVTTLNNANTFGNFTLKLPKAMTKGGYTVRFYLETTSNAALRIIKPHTEGANYTSTGGINGIIKEYHPLSLVNGLWTEVFVPYTEEYTNEVTFQIWGGANGVNTFYFDYIADGNVVEKMVAERAQAIVDALPEGYLADFSSEIYEGMIANSKYSSSLVAASLTAKYVDSFDNHTDLMKITTVNNNISSKFGGFSINLPKAMPTDSGFTITFYIESTGSKALRIINPASDSKAVSNKHEWAFEALDAAVGKWHTVFVPYSETYADASTVEFMFFMDKVSGTSGTNVIYIDSIVAGNQTA